MNRDEVKLSIDNIGTTCMHIHRQLRRSAVDADGWQVMLALEEQQAQLAQEKEDLQLEVMQLQGRATNQSEAVAPQPAERAAHAPEHAAAAALMSSLVSAAQVHLSFCAVP